MRISDWSSDVCSSDLSHHGGLVRAGEVALASATPERFLEIADGVVRTHPIKGTRRRDPDAARDRALITELRTDPKESAENVMIVDLMRNDLSRVCRPGRVAVGRLLELEPYTAAPQRSACRRVGKGWLR